MKYIVKYIVKDVDTLEYLKSMKKVSSEKLDHQSLRIVENNIFSSVLWQSSNSCGFSQTTLLPSVLIFLWISALQRPTCHLH